MIRKKNVLFYCLLILGLLLYATFNITPLIMSVVYSFTQYNNNFQFVGIQNYRMLFLDPFFWEATRNTLYFLGIALPMILVFSYLIGMSIVCVGISCRWSKMPYFITMIIPSAAVTFIWQILFGDYSFIATGILKISPWESRIQDIIPLLMLYIWKNSGYCILIFLVGWMNIGTEFYEAASIDGGNGYQKTYYITLPLMVPYLFFATILAFVQFLKIGRDIFILYGDYPKQSVYMLQNYFRQNFMSMNIEVMSSGAIIFSLIILIVVFIIYRLGVSRRQI